MARDDFEYQSITDFTPGIYSKYGGNVVLGRDGAAQIQDGDENYTFGCFPDPDGGLRPLPRRIRRYGVEGIDTLRNAAGSVVNHDLHPLARGVGTSDDGRRSKIGIIDAAVHTAERYDDAYDTAPFRRDMWGATKPDMLHILTSYREDPVDLGTDASSMFPALGRLVNKWRAFSLSEVDLPTPGSNRVNITSLQRIIVTRCARYEEGSGGSGVGAVATKASDSGSGYTYTTTWMSNWRDPRARLHDGWAAGSIAMGRAVFTIPGSAGITLDDVKNPGSPVVFACMQNYLPYQASESTEELFPNFLAGVGSFSYGIYETNSQRGLPRTANPWGPWTADYTPWYLIEHQDRFVGLINSTSGFSQDLNIFDGQDLGGATEIHWDTPANRIRFSEINCVAHAWTTTTGGGFTSATGLHGGLFEFWQFTENNGSSSSKFTPGTTMTGAPSAPPPEVFGNQLLGGIGCMFAWQNDLVIVPMTGEGSIVRGALEDSTVIRSQTIAPTGGIVCHGVPTIKGVVYGSRTGVYLWNGSESEHISPQLDGWFWDAGEACETHTDGYRRKADASMGRFGYSYPFVFAPNNWVMDLRTGAWSRLMDPADTTNPYPYMHYVTSDLGDVYAVRGCYDGLRTLSPPGNDQYFCDLYDFDERAWQWQWVSQPLQGSITRALEVRQLVVVGQGEGTIDVYVSGSDLPDEERFTFTFDDPDHSRRVRLPASILSNDVVLRVVSTGYGVSEVDSGVAPTLHGIHIGAQPRMQIAKQSGT